MLDLGSGGGIDVDLKTQNYKTDYIPKSHRSDFITIHPIKAQDNPQQCYRCHDAVAFCNSCHSRFPKGSLRIKSHMMLGANGQRYAPALNEHATEARRNLQSCQTCHPEGDVCLRRIGDLLAIDPDVGAIVDAVKVKANMPLALDWRLKTRELFETYFARGYEAVDFVRAGEVWGPTRASHNWYIIQQT